MTVYEAPAEKNILGLTQNIHLELDEKPEQFFKLWFG